MKNTDFDALFDAYDDEDFQNMLSGMSEAERAEFRRESEQLFAEVAEMFEAFDKRVSEKDRDWARQKERLMKIH